MHNGGTPRPQIGLGHLGGCGEHGFEFMPSEGRRPSPGGVAAGLFNPGEAKPVMRSVMAEVLPDPVSIVVSFE